MRLCRQTANRARRVPSRAASWAGLVALTWGLAVGSAQAESAAHGQQLFERRCVACHSLDAHRVGPGLRGVFERPAGKAPGYDYSRAMAQAMGYQVEQAAGRADIVAYLATLSHH
jgi:cytochrome c